MEAQVPQWDNLEDMIDNNKTECLNEDPSHPLPCALKQNNEYLFLQSDADPQLLINVTFQGPVRLHHILIQAKAGEPSAPSCVKLFINKPSFGFDEAENDACTEEFDLSDKNLNTNINLKFARF